MHTLFDCWNDWSGPENRGGPRQSEKERAVKVRKSVRMEKKAKTDFNYTTERLVGLHCILYPETGHLSRGAVKTSTLEW